MTSDHQCQLTARGEIHRLTDVVGKLQKDFQSLMNAMQGELKNLPVHHKSNILSHANAAAAMLKNISDNLGRMGIDL